MIVGFIPFLLKQMLKESSLTIVCWYLLDTFYFIIKNIECELYQKDKKHLGKQKMRSFQSMFYAFMKVDAWLT